MTKTMEAATESGRVLGVEANGIVEFRGIPYAGPPVGEWRFQPPHDPDPWDSFSADRFGPAAPQVFDPLELPEGTPIEEDNCLTLNIFTPAADSKKRPVMVYLHGGRWLSGRSGNPWYHGGRFVKRGGVVFVSVNYRLGALGFLHLNGVLTDREREKYGAGGNAGVLDQAKALAWVKRNIRAFGGDPENVTIFGESAGGVAVCAQMVLSTPEDLFQRAVVQSGGPHFRSSAWADRVTRDFMRCAGANDLKDLLQMPFPALIAAQADLVKDSPFADALFGPVVDGTVFKDGVMELIDGGQVHDVPFMIGTTLDELRYWMWYYPQWRTYDVRQAYRNLPFFRSMIDRSGQPLGVLEGLYRQSMPVASDNDIFWAVYNDMVFRVPSIKMLEALEASADHSAGRWSYLFTWPSPIRENDVELGAMHAIDLPFVFYNAADYHYFFDHNGIPEGLAAATQDAWIAFARSGDPNHAGLPRWKPYSIEKRATMKLDAPPELLYDPYGGQRRAWENMKVKPFAGGASAVESR